MMGWGNNGNAAGNSAGAIAYVPYGAFGGGYGGGTTVQQGFDQAAIMSGLNGIQTSVANGFANAEVSRCNQQANLLATLNANQNANTAAMNGLAMGLQNCCCENRQQIADVKYAIANDGAATRATIQSGVQSVLDKLCQQEIDALKEQNANLRTQLNLASLRESQTAQTSQILADNAAQTMALEQYLNPAPIPAYPVQNPNCCGQSYLNGCGCGAA